MVWKGVIIIFNVERCKVHSLQSYKLPLLWNKLTNSILIGSSSVYIKWCVQNGSFMLVVY